MAKKKEITLTQFQSWLEGVEELQPGDWCPDATQWKLIRNKIKQIVPDAPLAEASPTPVDNRPIHQPPSVFGGGAPAGGGNPGFTPAPEVPSSIPQGPVVAPSELAQSLLTGDGAGKSKTPSSKTGDASPFS